MFLLMLGMTTSYAHRSALSVAAPLMIKDLKLSPGVMGLLLSAFFWSYSLMQVPAGWLVDRLGVRKSYAWGFTLWSIASSLTGYARTPISLVVFRMGLGVGQSVTFPASARAVANWFQDRERGTVTAVYLAGVRLGAALIAGAGAFLLVKIGWKYFFLATGIIPLLWLLPWLRLLHGRETEPGNPSPSRPGASLQKQVSFTQSLALLRHRSVFGIFLGFFAYDYAWYVYLTWLPGYLELERHFGPTEMGIYSATLYLAMAVIILLSGFLSDLLIRRGYGETRVRKIFIVTGLVIACLIVPAGMVEDRMTAVWLLTISLCGLGLCAPNTWTLTQAVCSRNIVGTASGIQNFGGNLGGILAPALTGYIAQTTRSFALALGLTGAVLIVGVLSYCLLIKERVEVA